MRARRKEFLRCAKMQGRLNEREIAIRGVLLPAAGASSLPRVFGSPLVFTRRARIYRNRQSTRARSTLGATFSMSDEEVYVSAENALPAPFAPLPNGGAARRARNAIIGRTISVFVRNANFSNCEY